MSQNTDLPLELFPEKIHQLRTGMMQVERELSQLKGIRAERKNVLKSTEWQGLGSNDKIRDANFELVLTKDEVYRTTNQDIEKLEWDLNEAQFNLEKYENLFSVKKLRLREHIASMELQAATGIKQVTPEPAEVGLPEVPPSPPPARAGKFPF